MQRISFILYISLLLFCPLAFGTVENWSRTTLEICAALSFLFLVLYHLLNKTPGLKVPGITALFCLLCYMAFQLVPLPIGLVKTLSPATYELYRPLLDLSPDTQFIPLSVHRKSTLLMLFTYTAYGLFYLLTVYHCAKAKQLRQTVNIVTVLGVLIAIEAILQILTSPTAIYWFRSPPSSTPVGPWVYSNHFAGFMEMLFPLAVALFLYHRPQIDYSKSLKEKFLSLMTMPGANKHLLLGTGSILMAVSIILSLSRGGIITLSLAFLFFVYFSAQTTSNKRTRWAIVLTIFVALMISWFGWTPIMNEFGSFWGEEGLNTSGRMPVLLDSIKLFSASPLFGFGFGTFIHTFPSVRTVPGESLYDHAHNDYIELLADGGLIGFILVGWFVLAVLWSTIRKLPERRDGFSILVTSGVLTGILALLFHCLADFQMYSGANGLYFFFLSGLAVSSVHTRIHYRTKPTYLRETGYKELFFPFIAAVLLLCIGSWYKMNVYKAEQVTSPLHSTLLSKDLPREKLSQLHEDYQLAARLDRLGGEYPFKAGIISTLRDEKLLAQQEYLQACLTQPTSGEYLQQLGIFLVTENIEKKKELIDTSIQRDRLEFALYSKYSDWLFLQEQYQESFTVLNLAMERIPEKLPVIIDFIYPIRFTENEIRQLLPDIPAAWYEMGRKLEKNGKFDLAIIYYRRSIELAGNEEAVPAYFDYLYRILLKQQNEDKAIETLRMAIEYLPDHAPFRVRMGDYYLKNNIPYRARQEYTQALRLEPGNIYLRRKLESIEQQN